MDNRLVIKPHFKSLIPPLAPEEREQLEKNILRDGCRDPLVVWGDVLIDGHNRYEICQRHGIEFNTVSIEFASEEDAEDWIDANQLGRRNLSPDAASLLRGRRYNRAKKPHGGDRKSIPQNEGLKPTADRLADQHGVSRATIERDGAFASAVDAVKPIVPDIEEQIVRGEAPPKSAIVEAAKVAAENPEAAREIISKPHVAHNSGENEWYTPPTYIAAAREVMGSISLDPASCELANKTVGAKVFYTKEANGLEQEWSGNVWMNPPYAQPLIAQFAEKVAAEFEDGNIEQACVLVNNATDTAWFQRMMQQATAVCFPKGRIRFLDKNGNPIGAPLQGQAVIYFGKRRAAFVKHFQQFGFVL